MQPVERDCGVVEVDSISFETVLPETTLFRPKVSRKQEFWYNFKVLLRRPFSKPLPFTVVRIGICITNKTTKPIRFSLFDSLIPELVGIDDRPIKRGVYSTLEMRPMECDFPVVKAGESLVFFHHARLSWSGKRSSLKMQANDGTNWCFYGLDLGFYKIRFIYQNKISEIELTGQELARPKLITDLWQGNVSTPFVNFKIIK
jgi:hypothetical protein